MEGKTKISLRAEESSRFSACEEIRQFYRTMLCWMQMAVTAIQGTLQLLRNVHSIHVIWYGSNKALPKGYAVVNSYGQWFNGIASMEGSFGGKAFLVLPSGTSSVVALGHEPRAGAKSLGTFS